MKTKNLLQTIILVLSFVMMNQFANAQINYSDIPDVTLSTTGAVYPLDLNNDGTVDFNLSISSQTYSSSHCGTTAPKKITVSPSGQNNVLCTQTGNKYYPSALNLNFTVGSASNTWKGGSSQIMSGYSNVHCDQFCLYGCWYEWSYDIIGQWSNAADKYLGLKIKSGGNYYYGWVRMSTTGSSITIKDYAYCSTAVQTIFAGQTTTEYVIISSLLNAIYCAGSNISISYNAYGTFSAGNIFSAELSNASGNFATPVVIGTLASTASGTIAALIPSNTIYGTGYRIRVKSSSPLRISQNNGTNLSIQPPLSALKIAYNGLVSDSALINCPNVNTNYLAAPSGTNYSWQWKNNGVDIPGATSSYFYPSVSGNYSCSITNVCGTTVSNVIHTIVYPLPPDPTVTAAGPTEVCPGLTVTLNTTPVSGLTYQWHNNTSPISGATNSSYTAASSASLKVQVSNSYGCSKTTYTYDVYVRKPPVSVHWLIAESLSNYCTMVDYAGLSAEAPYVCTFQWRKNGTDIPGATSNILCINSPGTYNVRVTNPNGNCDSLTAGLNARLGSYNHSDPAQLKIFPNPIVSSAKILFGISQSQKISLKIFDVNGRLISTLADKIFEAGKNEIVWNAADVNAGIYFLQMQTAENLQTEKLIVTK